MKALLLFITSCLFVFHSSAAPTEIYVAYQLKDGEKIKEIAERFHVPFHKLVAYNKQWQTDGIKTGVMVRIPTEHIKRVTIANSQNKDNVLYENKNSYIIKDSIAIDENIIDMSAAELEMFAKNLYINIVDVNAMIAQMKSTSLGNDIILVFSDGTTAALSNPVDQQNILTSLKRNSFVSQNLNLAFNKK